jgi:hypothetical protein
VLPFDLGGSAGGGVVPSCTGGVWEGGDVEDVCGSNSFVSPSSRKYRSVKFSSMAFSKSRRLRIAIISPWEFWYRISRSVTPNFAAILSLSSSKSGWDAEICIRRRSL